MRSVWLKLPRLPTRNPLQLPLCKGEGKKRHRASARFVCTLGLTVRGKEAGEIETYDCLDLTL